MAIKRARADHASSRAFESMLIEEALQAARLSHDNVIAALDFECDAEGRCYLVMEYIEGIDLRAVIATGPIPISVFIVSELLVGLGTFTGRKSSGVAAWAGSSIATSSRPVCCSRGKAR